MFEMAKSWRELKLVNKILQENLEKSLGKDFCFPL